MSKQKIEVSKANLTRLLEAVQWTVSPYLDERNREELKDEYPHLAELLEAAEEFVTEPLL